MTHELQPAPEMPQDHFADDQIMAARLLVKVDQRLGRETEQRILHIAEQPLSPEGEALSEFVKNETAKDQPFEVFKTRIEGEMYRRRTGTDETI